MTGTTERPVSAPVTVPEAALRRYHVMAYIVGTLLVPLVLVALPLKYFGVTNVPAIVLGIPHGFLYPVLLLTVADLWARRRRTFPIQWVVLVALAGTVPFLSFVAERQVSARVRDGRF